MYLHPNHGILKQTFSHNNPESSRQFEMSCLHLCTFLASVLLSQVLGQCPDFYGRYATGQCDAYVECIEGVPHQRTCPDGLFFKDGSPGYPCVYAAEVDCTGRSATQVPNPSRECPNSFGIYAIGGPNDCGLYMNCVHGRAFTRRCPEGLAFNELTNQCDWPDLVPTCNAEAFLGFSCPGVTEEFYASGQCDRFFSCSTGKPRLNKCGRNQAFNQITNSCDDSINVPGC